MGSGFLGNTHVSRYASVRAYTAERVLLAHELSRIRSGYYQPLILPCRSAFSTDRLIYKQLKSNLPAVTYCGVFQGQHKADSLVQYNQLIVMDLDNIGLSEMLEIKGRLFQDKHVLACWTSPSGAGIKVLMQVESSPRLHKHTFDRILDYLSAIYGVDADPSGCDVCRLCYVSFDSEMLIKASAAPFPKVEDEWLLENLEIADVNRNLTNKKYPALTETVSLTDSSAFNKTEGRNKRDDREAVRKVTAFLKRTHQSITSRYQNWFKVALAVSNSFTYDVGKRIYLDLCRLDGPHHDEYKSEQLLEYSYRKRKLNEVTFATILYLAREKGFESVK